MQVKDRYFNGTDVDGEVGIEIEMEGVHFPNPDMFQSAVNHVWSWHNDGSLRGAANGEIVLSKPVPRDSVVDVLASASAALKDAGTKLQPSVRTGVHVHVNIRNLSIEQTFIFMLTFLLFEQSLVRYCGEDRQGNLFCLRSQDAEAYLDALEHAIRHNDLKSLYTDQLRYSAMNPKALYQYGSLEFRCLKTPDDLMDIVEWVDILLYLKDFSLTIKDPRDLIEQISLNGGDAIAHECFREYTEALGNPDWTTEMYEGLRRIQPAVFAKEWNAPEHEDIVLHTELPQTLYEAKLRGALTALEVVTMDPKPNKEVKVVMDDVDVAPIAKARPKRQPWDIAGLRNLDINDAVNLANEE